MIFCSLVSMQAIESVNTGPNMAQSFNGECKVPVSDLFSQIMLWIDVLSISLLMMIGTLPGPLQGPKRCLLNKAIKKAILGLCDPFL